MIYKKSWKYILCKDKSTNCKDYCYYRPKAIKDFSNVKNGEIGGFLKCFNNLSQSGDCWIYDEAIITIRASVKDNAVIRNSALICGHAKVSGNAMVSGKAIIAENASVYDNARISGEAKVYGCAVVYENAQVYGDVTVRDMIVNGDRII